MSYGFLEGQVKNKNIVVVAVLAVLVGGSWWWSSSSTDKSCVTVYVDYGVLDNNSKSIECIPTDVEIDGMTAVNMASHAILGTEKYGLDVICKVDSLPKGGAPIGIKGHEEYIETCKDMPPAFAYWAILVKNGSGEWGWAQTGLRDVKLNPGDSIGLVFAENENVRFPK